MGIHAGNLYLSIVGHQFPRKTGVYMGIFSMFIVVPLDYTDFDYTGICL
jgi:hypothetical protein